MCASDLNGVMIVTEKDFAPYFLLDMRLSCDFRKLQLYIDVTNATNTRYCDFGGIYMPGVWATAGVVVLVR